MSVIFLDVGQGEAVLVRTAEGDILINAGSDATEAMLCAHLRQLGVKELALMVFTSPDSNRVGGGDGVLKEFAVGEVWFNGSFEENESTYRLGLAINRETTSLHRTDVRNYFQLGGLTLGVLFPFLNAVTEDNMVLRLVCGEERMILMGAATAELEQRICEAYDRTVLQSSVLSVGRSGSNSATTQRLLDAVSPRYAVISCEENNLYGNPSGEVLALLEAAEVRVLRTDRLGEIVFCCDGGEFYIPDDVDE